jgi:hypothetical protein
MVEPQRSPGLARQVPSEPIVKLLSGLEHFELGAVLDQSVDSSVTTGHFQTPPPCKVTQRRDVKRTSRACWMTGEVRESEQKTLLNVYRQV